MNFIKQNIVNEGTDLTKKIKILTISDHPLLPSGVGTQTKYVIEALLNTGRFDVVSLGGAVKHQSYEPKRVEGFKGECLWYIIMCGTITPTQNSTKYTMNPQM